MFYFLLSKLKSANLGTTKVLWVVNKTSNIPDYQLKMQSMNQLTIITVNYWNITLKCIHVLQLFTCLSKKPLFSEYFAEEAALRLNIMRQHSSPVQLSAWNQPLLLEAAVFFLTLSHHHFCKMAILNSKWHYKNESWPALIATI